MGNSLQEQLMKAGLVDEQRAKKLQQEKRKKTKQQRKGKPAPVDENRQRAQEQQAKKAARDRELNRKRKDEAERKALIAQIKQLIDENRLPKRDGEVAYNFVDGRKVKRLYVTPTIQTQLSGGSAAIVKLHGQYDIVPMNVAEKIRERDATCVILENPATGGVKEDEAYADYPVPDDLIW